MARQPALAFRRLIQELHRGEIRLRQSKVRSRRAGGRLPRDADWNARGDGARGAAVGAGRTLAEFLFGGGANGAEQSRAMKGP